MKSISFSFKKLISLLRNFFSTFSIRVIFHIEESIRNVSNFLTSHLFSLARTMTSKQRKREARKQTKLKIAKSVFFAYFDFFNSTVIDDDSEWDIFSKFTDILQRFQQFQLLYREFDLLNLLHDCLMNFVLNWFKSQSEFISLHDFDITFTKAFSSNEFATNSTTLQKQQKMKISISNRCQWCQLIYETWNSHRFQYSSCAARNQQAYEFVLQFLEKHTNEIIEKSTIFISSASSKQQKLNVSSKNLKMIKKIKTNAVKNAKRIKSKVLKIQKVAKSTSKFQNIDIFDSTLTCENRRFNEIAKFLQHFQQCQHLYRKSDLFMLLLICLWNSAFDIWYDKQNVMKSTSLNEWIETLRVDFANVSFAIIKTSKIICMLCDSNFNFKKKFREHVREQHTKKSVRNSFLSVDTLKSICETMKKSTIIDSFVSQKSDISIAISRQIFDSVMTLKTVNTSKNSHLSSDASEIVLESMKNTSTQCSFISSRLSLSQSLESEHHEFAIQKSEIESSLLKISTDKSVDESEKNSTITDSSVSFISQRSFKFSLVFKRSCFICRIDVSSVQEHYLEFSSCHEALRNRLEQQFARHAYQRKQKAQKQVENFYLSIYAVNSVCEIEKTSFFPHNFSVSELMFESAIAFRTVILLKRSNFSLFILETMSKSARKSATCRRCNKIFNFNNKFHEHIRERHARKFVKSFDLRVFASEFTHQIIEKSTSIDSSVSFVSQKSSIFSATSRSQKFWFSIIFKSIIASTRSNLSIATYKINSKSMKNAVVNCSLIFSSTSSHISVQKHQKSHIQKFYLTMNELHRMFVEKSKSFDLQQHQIRCRSSQSFDFRQFDRSCSTSSKKSYLILENLFEMFDEKLRKKRLFHDQNNVFSREFFSNQSRITVYFKFTVNQKSSISQDSKSSKSKSLNQHMSAKSIRIVFSEILSEISIKLSYKLSNVFCINLKFPVEISFFIFILLRFFSTFFLVFAFVSIIFVAEMNCINVYQQVISIIDRVDIEFVVSKRNWEKTRNKLLEYSITKHLQKNLLHLLNELYTSIIACAQISMR